MAPRPNATVHDLGAARRIRERDTVLDGLIGSSMISREMAVIIDRFAEEIVVQWHKEHRARRGR